VALHRYWVTFDLPAGELSLVSSGCGITARDREDLLAILNDQVFPRTGRLSIRRVDEDVDVSTLDPQHVRPNMDPPVGRGVWFPLGFQ
jgi:hypothetical protein